MLVYNRFALDTRNWKAAKSAPAGEYADCSTSYSGQPGSSKGSISTLSNLDG